MVQGSKRSFPLLLVLNIVCCCCFFYPILGSLNSSMMTLSGDGIKNYFCYLYFIRYDSGTHFTGMNYPFGENILFTDNMPALSWSLVQLKLWFPNIIKYSLVLMHSTFLLSYFLCSFYLHKILKLFGVSGWWAILSSIFIAYFSPQFFRLLGHFSLGLVCFFPMVIYWIMQYERKQQVRYLLFLVIIVTLFTFLHLYYLVFALALTAAYCFSYCITNKAIFLKKIRYTSPLLLSVAVPVLILKIYLLLTDNIKDRPITPNGYRSALATGQDILTSDYNFIGSNAFAWIFNGSSRWSEGYAYIGIVTISVLLHLAFRILRSLIPRVSKKEKRPSHSIRSYRVWIITAFLLLLLSMGVPFIWGMDFLLDWFPPLKQFRSIGRIAWIFYYLVMIYASVFLSRFFQYLQKRGYHKPRIALIVIIIAVWFIEWKGYCEMMRSECTGAENRYNRFVAKDKVNWKDWLIQQGHDATSFQGIIGLPYTHIGSEKTGMQEDYHSIILTGAEIAYNTGLKMTDVMMSRTSWSQTFANLRLCDGRLTPKAITSCFSNKPFLLFVFHSVLLTPGEEALIRRAKFIGKREDVAMYSLDIQAMVKQDEAYTDSLKKSALEQPQREGLLEYDPGAFYYSNHFEDNRYTEAFAGSGAMASNDEEIRLVANCSVAHFTQDTLFIVSAWFKCHNNVPYMPEIIFKQYDNDNILLAEGKVCAGQSTYVIEDWFKAEKLISIGKAVNRIELYVRGGKLSFKALDELLIYPYASTYFYKADDALLLLNNRPVNLRKVD